MTYAEIVAQAASGHLNSVTILYLDPQIMTRTAVTPQSLEQIGCRIDLRSDSPKWSDLIAILRAESPVEAKGVSGEVRWGLLFPAVGGASEGIYFGPYYGPQSDKMAIFGYVNTQPVQVSPQLPKKMSSFIRGLNCTS